MTVPEIKALLEARSITHATLADHLGLSRVHVTQMLSGKRRMHVDVLRKIEAFIARHPSATRGVAETAAAFQPAPQAVSISEARILKRGKRMSAGERETWLRDLHELGEAGKRLPRVSALIDDDILGYDETT